MASWSTRRAVHPGWHSTEEANQTPETTSRSDQEIRFNALMQLLRTAGALERAACDALADLELTAGAFGALMELQHAGDAGVTPSELARRLSVARRTATLYVDILARQGWAIRMAHPDDGRKVLAQITPDGEALLSQFGEMYGQRLASLLEKMSPIQAERLGQLLDILAIDGLSAMAND